MSELVSIHGYVMCSYMQPSIHAGLVARIIKILSTRLVLSTYSMSVLTAALRTLETKVIWKKCMFHAS
jgi:hypothetical protein